MLPIQVNLSLKNPGGAGDPSVLLSPGDSLVKFLSDNSRFDQECRALIFLIIATYSSRTCYARSIIS